MTESNFFNNTATDHHEHQHGTTVPDETSSDGSTQTSESTHEDDQHNRSKEEKEPKEMKTKMRNIIAQTLTGLALIFAFSQTAQFQPVTFNAFTSTDNAFATSKDTPSKFITTEFTSTVFTATNFSTFENATSRFNTPKFTGTVFTATEFTDGSTI